MICPVGVADQLQTNYASDLRHILKCVFELNSTNMDEAESVSEPAITPTQNLVSTEIENISNIESRETSSGGNSSTSNEQQGQSSAIQQTTSHSLNRQNSSPRRIFDGK